MSGNSPHEYSRSEVEQVFLATIHSIVNYWSTLPGQTERDRCEGVAFSILSAIDGCSAALPRFLLASASHPDDKLFCQERGENWFPEPPSVRACDISGRLHEHLMAKAKCAGTPRPRVSRRARKA